MLILKGVRADIIEHLLQVLILNGLKKLMEGLSTRLKVATSERPDRFGIFAPQLRYSFDPVDPFGMQTAHLHVEGRRETPIDEWWGAKVERWRTREALLSPPRSKVEVLYHKQYRKSRITVLLFG